MVDVCFFDAGRSLLQQGQSLLQRQCQADLTSDTPRASPWSQITLSTQSRKKTWTKVGCQF